MHLHPSDDLVNISPDPERLRLTWEVAAEDPGALRAKVSTAKVDQGEEEAGVDDYVDLGKTQRQKKLV